MKKHMFDVEKTEFKEVRTGKGPKEPRLEEPHKSVMDFAKIEHILNADRTMINYDSEINSLLKHEEMFTRRRL